MMKRWWTAHYRDFWYWLNFFIGQYPQLYYGIFARKYPFNRMRVTEQTRVCIEGFPRSANSYAVVAFKLANPEVPVAHHLHVPAQIIKAVQYQIPTVCVIRHPKECVASFMVFQRSTHPGLYLSAYIRFHQIILPFVNQFLVADFQQVVTDFNAVITAMNEKFGTQFLLIDNLPAQQARIFKRLEEINLQFFKGDHLKSMLPDENRKQLKQTLENRVVNHRLFNRAVEIYRELNKYSLPIDEKISRD